MKIISHNLEETKIFAKDFIEKNLSLSKNDTATIVGLYGDLGSGKTAFVKISAELLGITETITSPTFVIEKIYAIPKNPNNQNNVSFDSLIHIDAYRLEKGEELAKLGWKNIISNPKNLILIEWPVKVADSMPPHISITFTFVDDTTREMSVGL